MDGKQGCGWGYISRGYVLRYQFWGIRQSLWTEIGQMNAGCWEMVIVLRRTGSELCELQGAGDYEFIQYLLCVLLAILSKKYTGKDIKKLHIEKAILLKICAMIMLFIIPNMNFGKLTNLIRLARINSVLMNFSYR